MSLRQITAGIVLILAAICLLSNALGRAGTQDAGNTGAPGDETLGNGEPRTCISCHSTNTNNYDIELGIEVLDDGIPINTYVPDHSYDVRVTVNVLGGSPVRYGFQLIALVDSTEEDLDTWSNPGNGVRIATTSVDRTYIEQVFPNEDSVFTAQWTAPPKGTGGVSFYSACIASNWSATNAGDAADTTVLKLAEAPVSSAHLADFLSSYRIIPTAFSQNVALEMESTELDFHTCECQLVNASGATVVATQTRSFQSDRLRFSLQLEESVNGMVFFLVNCGKKTGIFKAIAVD